MVDKSKSSAKPNKEEVVKDELNKEDNPNPDQTEQKAVEATAKAGKRSSKAIKEANEAAAKQERKAQVKSDQHEEKPKAVIKPARSKAERAGKNYRKAFEKVDKSKSFSLPEAVELAIQTNPAKFDATVELHINLNVDPKQADQNIRAMVALPAGTGKKIRVAVFAEADSLEAAKKAGADIAMADEFLQLLDKEQIDFDILIASPAQMPKLGKYARLLGPKGLMPNPKSGTVAKDVAKAVIEAKAGKVEYRVDSTGIIHIGVGKVSFKPEDLVLNAESIIKSVKANKPASVKGTYIKSSFLTTTMGPSIKLETN